jgi:alkanesulfonate monooxygenase SsuD/methylene tetrahydromethanopterin reductase-like flavin-dependent oxidoreductase (luciferase family)
VSTAQGLPVDLGLHLWAQDTSWRAVRIAARRAEAAGYRFVWTWDHLYAIFGDPTRPSLEGWTLLAAMAEATDRVEVGLLVSANPFRNPGLVAKMAVTVDEISGGRLVLGLGAAWNELEHRAHGIPFGMTPGERLRWLEEAVGAITSLLAGETYSSPPTGHYALREAHHAPRPIRGTIPILIGGGGERRTLRIVAEHAHLWNVMGPAGLVARKSVVLDEHCAAIGRDPTGIRRTVTVRALIRDREEDAVREWARLMRGLGVTDRDLPAFTGPPRLVAEQLQPYIDGGFDTITIELPAPYDPETIERLVGDVVPLLHASS